MPSKPIELPSEVANALRCPLLLACFISFLLRIYLRFTYGLHWRTCVTVRGFLEPVAVSKCPVLELVLGCLP